MVGKVSFSDEDYCLKCLLLRSVVDYILSTRLINQTLIFGLPSPSNLVSYSVKKKKEVKNMWKVCLDYLER